MADQRTPVVPSTEEQTGLLTSRDPRVLLLMTLVFVVGVVSVPSLRPDRLLAFLAIPIFMTLATGLRVGRILARTATALPFAVLLGVAAFLSDTRAVPLSYGMNINAGLLMGVGVVMKTILTVWMAVLMVTLLTFPVVTRAAGKLGMPKALVQTVFFLYRYLQDMVDQARAVIRSHRLRSGGRRRMSLHTASATIMALLAASLSRGARVGRALEIRGFTGRLPEGRSSSFSLADGMTLVLFSLLIVVLCLGFDRLAYLARVF